MNQLWNSPSMQKLRQNLLQGEVKGTPCENCYDRRFNSDHSLFGQAENVPRYSQHGEKFDQTYETCNRSYQQGLTQVEHLPIELYIFTSQLCNYKCVMCVQNIDEKNFPVEKVIAILQEMGMDKLDRFGWVGGESLLSADGRELLDFVSKHNQHGTCIYITTNGSLLKQSLKKLEKIKNLFLTVSIDGSEKVFDKIRVNGKWEQLLSNLESFAEIARHRPLWKTQFRSIVMKSTLGSLMDLIKLGQNHGASVFFMPLNGNLIKEDIFRHSPSAQKEAKFIEHLTAAQKFALQCQDQEAAISLEKVLEYAQECQHRPLSNFKRFLRGLFHTFYLRFLPYKNLKTVSLMRQILVHLRLKRLILKALH